MSERMRSLEAREHMLDVPGLVQLAAVFSAFHQMSHVAADPRHALFRLHQRTRIMRSDLRRQMLTFGDNGDLFGANVAIVKAITQRKHAVYLATKGLGGLSLKRNAQSAGCKLELTGGTKLSY